MSDLGNKKVFAKNLQKYMDLFNLTRKDLSININVPYSTISDWLNAKKYPRIDKIELLSHIFSIEKSDLIENKSSVSLPSDTFLPNFKKIPLLGYTAAGKPIISEESFDGYIDVEDKYNIDFCLRVKGESMIDAGINDGDIVFIHSQPTVENGQIAVVRINGDEVTLKRFYKIQNGVMLQSENPGKINYPPMIFTENDIDSFFILGLAVLKQSEIR